MVPTAASADNRLMEPFAGERRIVSVLLVDVVGSTAIGERLGPERSKFLFDEVARLLRSEVERYGGVVAQFTGDGLYALFGVPVAHDDDAERAVRAALGMQTAVVGYAKDVAEAYGAEVAVRVGVNTGPVVLLREGHSEEERYNALGDTVNTAARLQGHAGAGGVVVGPVTARRVETVFALEPLGPLALKGKTDPVTAFRIGRERATFLRPVAPLVGRDDEVAILDDVFGRLIEGRGAVVAVTGEAGIGKSRLVAEARMRWDERVRFLTAQGVSYAEDIPYYPLRELLRGFLGVGAGDPEARVRLELKARLAATLGERADRWYPFLASLLGLGLEETAKRRLDALARDAVQRQTHEAVAELARALSREQPLALVLEDLHFVDDPTLELIEELLPLTDEEAVVVLLLYRSDPDLRSWRLGETARRVYPHRLRELQLAPLDARDSAALAASAAVGLPGDVAARVAERAGGNPLFLEEAALDAMERGNGAAVPAAIHEALQARLDRLTPDVRDVASIASVVGRSFGLPLLERLVSPARLRPALAELQRLDVVVEERRRPSPEYRFRHGLVQEAAYTTLLEGQRRELHLAVGTALEEADRDELSEAYGLLAHHFSEADEPQRAARYLVEAGDAARAVDAGDEAVTQYRRALAFLDRLGDSSGAARSVLFKIALGHHLASDFEAADAAWAEAFQRPESPPIRLEPSARLETAFGPSQGWAPGHSYVSSDFAFVPNLFRGLLRLERGLDVVPDLAERISVSPDGCRYTIGLRHGLRWSDGQLVTAHDFAFTYRTMREQRVQTTHLLAGLNAEALDDTTLELRLPDANPQLLYLLSQAPLSPWPRHHVVALGDEWHRPVPRVGNGPYVVHAFDDEKAELRANPFWHGSRGNVGSIVVRFTDGDVARDAWLAGELDYLLFPSAAHLFADAADTALVPVPALSVSYVRFTSHPPFDDERVRRALAHGLDRGPLAAATGNVPATGGLLPPAMPAHSHDLAPAHDPVLARNLLAEAGYAGGRGLPELRLVHPPYGGRLRAELEAAWAGQWSDLGVRLTQAWVANEEVYAEASRDCSFHEWGWVADYPDPEGIFGALAQGTVEPLPSDLLRLFADARAERSRDARLARYREADRSIVADGVWMVPTVYPASHVLTRPWVSGLWAHPLGIAPLDDVVVAPHAA